MRLQFEPTGIPHEARPAEDVQPGDFDADFEVYETDLDTQLLHRFKLIDGQLVDTYDGKSDDEVRAWDAENPVPSERIEPEETSPTTPAGSVEDQLAEQRALNVQQQQQLDDLTQMILEA